MMIAPRQFQNTLTFPNNFEHGYSAEANINIYVQSRKPYVIKLAIRIMDGMLQLAAGQREMLSFSFMICIAIATGTTRMFIRICLSAKRTGHSKWMWFFLL